MVTEAEDARAEPKARIFISYSRKDISFADRLEEALKARGFEALIDRTEIYAFEDWWNRIQALISRADTVVFVLSPDAVASDVALKEVAHAVSLNKRFAPVVCRAVDDNAVPEVLRRLNFIFFNEQERFEESADRLAEALRTDIGWVRQHTECGDAARHWSRAGRPAGLLLRSPTLEEAERWIASRPHSAPLPTEETQRFVTESRRWATRRRNILTGSLAAGLIVALVLAGLAYWERRVAVAQRDVAEARRIAALAALTNSEMLRGNSDAALRLGVHAARLALALDQNANSDSVARAALINAIMQSKWQTVARNVRSPIFSSDGSRILTTSYDNVTKSSNTLVLDSVTGNKIADWPGEFTAGRFTSDGSRIVALVDRKFARVSDAKTGIGIADLRGHSDDINSASFSPDGLRVVTASQDKTARIWDSTSGNLIFLLRGHDGPVNSAALSYDGSRIVTASSDHTARVWDAATGELITILRGHEDRVITASFSSDGFRIVTASYDQTARIWDSSTGAQLQVLRGHTFVLYSADFSSDGSRILTTSWDHTARLWNAETGTQITAVYSSGLSSYGLESAAFSPNGSQVAVGSGNGLRILDAADGKELLALAGHESQINFVAFSPNGSQVATESFDDLRIWNLADTPKVMVLRGSESSFNSVEISPHGTHVMGTLEDGTLRVWGIKTAKQLLKWDAFQTNSAHYSPDGSQFVVVYSGVAEVFDADTGKTVMKANLLDRGVRIRDAQFSPDGQRIVTTSGKYDSLQPTDNNAEIWDTKNGKEIAVLRGHSATITSAYFSPDGSHIVTASEDKTARLWDVVTGAETAVLGGHTEWVYAAFFAPDGARVVTESGDKTTRIWDIKTGTQISLLRGTIYDWLHPASSHPELTSDGSRIVTVSDDVAIIWDTANGKELAVLRGHNGQVGSAAFSPDGLCVVTGSNDETARIWDSVSGRQIAVLRGHDASVERAIFSPNGSQILTTAHDHTARIWDVRFASTSTEHLVTRVCTKLLGGLTELKEDEMLLAGYVGESRIDVCAGR
jgi:WD40 repeat protein